MTGEPSAGPASRRCQFGQIASLAMIERGEAMQFTEFKGHPIWEAVEETAQKLTENPPSDDPKDVAPRLRAVAAYVLGFRGRVLADLFTLTMLNNVQATWKQVDAYVDQFLASKNRAQLDQASSHLDQVMNAVALWPSPISRSERMQTVTDSFQAFVEQVEVQSATLASTADEFEAGMAELRAGRDALRQEIDALKAEIDAQTKTIRDEATSQNELFNSNQTQRSTEFQNFLTERRKEHDAALTADKQALAKHQDTAAAMLSAMEGTQGRLEKLTAQIAGTELGRKYGFYSLVQYLLAGLAFVAGVVLLVRAGDGLLGSIAEVGPRADVSWQWVTLKFGVTATLVGAASVAVALGRGFLRNAATNKRVELEINALGPFLEDIRDDEDTRRLRLVVADRLFGHAWEDEKFVRSEKPSREENSGVLREIRDAVEVLRARSDSGA